MHVTVNLNTQKEIIWGLPASKTILTSQSPSVTFETNLMTPAQKQSLALAIKTGKVTSNVSPELFFQAPEPVATQANVSPPQKDKNLQIPIPKTPDQLASEAKNLLDGSVSEVKKQILVTNNLRFLKMLLAIEEGGKARVTLTKLLNDQVKQIEKKTVQAANSVPPGPKLILPDISAEKMPGMKAVSYDVEETEVEEITIRFGDDEEKK